MALYDPFDQFVDHVLPPDIDKGLLSRFRTLSRAVNVDRGQMAVRADGGDKIAFIASGSTKLVAHALGGREQIVGFQFATEIVSVPSSAAHAFTITALEPSELLHFSAEPFFKLVAMQSEIVVTMMEQAYLALGHCREKSITLGRASAQERVAGFLLAMADRIGTSDGDGQVLNLPMSRRDIADSLGLSIETVSRQVTALRTQGLLSTDGRSIIRLRDCSALNERAGNLSINA